MLKYEILTEKNLELALKTQAILFPDCDGQVNFMAEVNKSLFEKRNLGFQEYQKICLVYKDDECIGLTGLYAYNIYPEDVWLGWFGILEKYRRQGFGNQVLNWTGEQAKKDGFKNIRLYTYTDEDLEAVSFYRSVGMMEEEYDFEKSLLPYRVSVFSRNLENKEVAKWGNKNIYLYRQYLMEQDPDDVRSIEEMNRLYEENKVKEM